MSSIDEITWDMTDDPGQPDVATIDRSLDSFNHSAADLAAVRRIACFARGSHRELVGGAIARTWGRCCELQQLWVAEPHRRNGIGSHLAWLVEEEARRRGCTLIYLETFSFQAPGLYRRLGYVTACEFAGFPGGVVKYVMRKPLG